MAAMDDLRRIALALPEAEQTPGDPLFTVRGKQFVWTWRERVHPKKTKVPRPDVLAVRVPDQPDKSRPDRQRPRRCSSPSRTTTGTPSSWSGCPWSASTRWPRWSPTPTAAWHRRSWRGADGRRGGGCRGLAGCTPVEATEVRKLAELEDTALVVPGAPAPAGP